MNVRRRIAVAVGTTLAAVGIATGVALGAGSGASPPVATQAPAAKAQAQEPARPDHDALRQGDQTTPDAPGQVAESTAADPAGNPQAEGPDAAAESPAAENAPEQAEPNEPALPGGGHQDAPSQDVDHQFEGVE